MYFISFFEEEGLSFGGGIGGRGWIFVNNYSRKDDCKRTRRRGAKLDVTGEEVGLMEEEDVGRIIDVAEAVPAKG